MVVDCLLQPGYKEVDVRAVDMAKPAMWVKGEGCESDERRPGANQKVVGGMTGLARSVLSLPAEVLELRSGIHHDGRSPLSLRRYGPPLTGAQRPGRAFVEARWTEKTRASFTSAAATSDGPIELGSSVSS